MFKLDADCDFFFLLDDDAALVVLADPPSVLPLTGFFIFLFDCGCPWESFSELVKADADGVDNVGRLLLPFLSFLLFPASLSMLLLLPVLLPLVPLESLLLLPLLLGRLYDDALLDLVVVLYGVG